MEYETILVDHVGDVLKITLNRPDRLNACPPRMAVEIADALRDQGGARAILMTGSGRAFCSGADLSADGASSIATGKGAYGALTQAYNPVMMALSRAPVPVVSAVNGPAAGIGCSLALASDFVFASRSAYFLQAFVNIGLVPDGGASWMLTRLIGKARATQMMMLGEKIGAEQAENWGLIYKAVDDAVLQDEALALATRLAAGPTVALGIMRQNLVKALESDYASALLTEAEGQLIAGDSGDALEGATSFLEKRKPAFTGK
ncbi:2-(1,2-epoxy-1,2-dihydrophenyl)acetyl-CoA isomerase [Novosphingobium hassiacum]|uniref:2-(1,2-epoxy-1,2-dihydrophenyl)acetyl-CoA isomerase n=1 Tax=Novosphingobium hassiacum TaxID=173676 RepID=A0A7W5ZWI0_9SPHN|nr:enoyl-CoA hydratase-related protein [Novosphingobium hassiacum]MBB3861233.1 2-(1,2-epoxy-1,2-dihydrophenyl)acetyl-CoA isomerase [Novosphingobium hassiacum]